MLKLAGESAIGLERIEQLVYNPGMQNTADLEASTKTITATSKPGTADYSKALTLPAPSDARLVVKRIVARLQVTRDSGTSNNLYCTVAVDSADGSSNVLFNAVDVQASSLQATDLTSGDVWNLLRDGSAHTFYFFFWTDSGDSVISLVRLWEGVGTCATTGPFPDILDIQHEGFASITYYSVRIGSGSTSARLSRTTGLGGEAIDASIFFSGTTTNIANTYLPTVLLGGHAYLTVRGSVATDLNYLGAIIVVLREEQ